MKLKSLKIEPWATDSSRQWRDAEFIDAATGVTIKIPLSADDVDMLEDALKDTVDRVLEEMKHG